MTFDEWWKLTKPAGRDELKPYFEEAWRLSARSELKACVRVCLDKRDGWMPKSGRIGHFSNAAAMCAAAIIKERSNA